MTSGGASGLGDAEWASRVAERLPADDVLRLARAAAGGAFAVRELRAQEAAPVLRYACDELLNRLAGYGGPVPRDAHGRSDGHPAWLSGLLTGAARAVERARRHQSIDVVWTGPESGITTSRLTAATVVDLISLAQNEILLVSFAALTEPSISAALHAAAIRGVTITLLAERHADNPSYLSDAIPFPGLDVIRLHWPGASRPQGAALHAKAIVIDDRIALVGSANLTGRAMEDNLECGILIRGGTQPRAIRDHITGLFESGQLRRF